MLGRRLGSAVRPHGVPHSPGNAVFSPIKRGHNTLFYSFCRISLPPFCLWLALKLIFIALCWFVLHINIKLSFQSRYIFVHFFT